jgi:glycosyltransferase involved in cell wall biosynthesis
MVWQERLVLRRATHILAISHYTASRIRKEVPEVSDKVQVLSYPIDTDEFHPSATHSSRWREFAGWTLISVGRLDDPRKNIPALLKALPLVQEKIGKIRLKLIGSGAESVTSYIEEMKLGPIVECLGHVPKTRLVQELQSSDLFILPSRQEGLGLVVLEAMACGLAVVSTRCGGPEKHVRDGETGYLVAQNDHKAIAAGIIQALQDPDKLLEMGIYARQLVLQNNSYAGVETQLRTVLGEVYPEFMPWMAEARNHADSYS